MTHLAPPSRLETDLPGVARQRPFPGWGHRLLAPAIDAKDDTHDMAQTLYQLYNLLFDSIPTILIFVVLNFYLKRVLYRPLREVLSARGQRIDGRQAAARATLEAAEAKLAGYAAARRQQQVDDYRRIEARRRDALQASQQAMAEARHQAAEAMLAARQQLAEDNAQARTQLQGAAEAAAKQILAQVLGQARPAGTPGVGA